MHRTDKMRAACERVLSAGSRVGVLPAGTACVWCQHQTLQPRDSTGGHRARCDGCGHTQHVQLLLSPFFQLPAFARKQPSCNYHPVVPRVLCPPMIPVRTSQPRGCPAPSCVLGCFLGKKVAKTAPGTGASRRAEQPRCVCLLCWSLRSRVPSTLPSGRIRRKWPPLLQYRSLGFL